MSTKLGRPKLPEGTALVTIGMRVRPDQKEFLEKTFTQSDRSKFLRDMLDEYIRNHNRMGNTLRLQ